MLSPKRVKYRKQQKGRIKGLAHRGSEVSFGQFGIQSTQAGWLPPPQIEAGRAGADPRAQPRWHGVWFGQLGIQATQAGWLTSRQIEAGRVALTRHIKRGGKVWIRIFPD